MAGGNEISVQASEGFLFLVPALSLLAHVHLAEFLCRHIIFTIFYLLYNYWRIFKNLY